MKPSFFEEKDRAIIFTGKRMEVYIPEYYFEKGVAYNIGTHFKTLGVLNFRVFMDIDGTKPDKIKTLNIPTSIYTYPSGGFENQTIDLVGKGEEKYVVLTYYNGDKLCDTETPALLDNFRVFLDIFIGGKLPGTIPYNKVMEIWSKNFILNGINFNIPDVVKEIIVYKIYRWKKDPTIPFGAALAKNPNLSQYDYITIGAREITRMDSAYAGFVFEDFDTSVGSAILTTKSGRKEVESPIEEILKY